MTSTKTSASQAEGRWTDALRAPSPLSRKAKRTLGFDNLFSVVGAVLASSPVLLRALFRPRTSAALREKVMLGVTSVTDCRYCAWGHGHWAMAQGVSLEEVNQILGQQTEALQAKAPTEAAAILFAQHYGEHLEQFDREAIANLRTFYSDAQVAEILAYVRAITLGGLTGNTLDAGLDRLRGTRGFWWWLFGKVPSVSAQQLDAMRKEGTQAPQLVDVRSDDEWRAGHIAGALCTPVTQFGSRIAALRLDKTRPIIAMCRSGGRSKVAVRLLQRHGFTDVFELQGGMRAWQAAGRPVEVEAGPVARG
jgi:AhpD family alkylhydroperoxidase